METFKIYKSIFGMYYDAGNNRIFVENMNVNLDHNCSSEMPIYVTYDGEKYKEVVTGLVIPKVINSYIPGFGIYGLKEIVTIEDYTNIIHYLTLAKEYENEFNKTLIFTRDNFNIKHDDYIKNHSDSFGPLLINKDQRENHLLEKYDNYNDIAIKLVKDLTKEN